MNLNHNNELICNNNNKKRKNVNNGGLNNNSKKSKAEKENNDINVIDTSEYQYKPNYYNSVEVISFDGFLCAVCEGEVNDTDIIGENNNNDATNDIETAVVDDENDIETAVVDDENDIETAVVDENDMELVYKNEDAAFQCKGICGGQIYHIKCVKNFNASKYKCTNCELNIRECFECKQTDVLENLIECEAKQCFRNYHQLCIENSTYEHKLSKNGKLRCAAHACDVCNGQRKSNKKEFCIRCPTGYHSKCRPPSVALLLKDNLFICKHHDVKPTTYGFVNTHGRKTLEDWRYNPLNPTVEVFKKQSLIFHNEDAILWEPPSEIVDFRLPKHIWDEGHEELRRIPPDYKKIRTNKYIVKPLMDIEKPQKCECTEEDGCCEGICINRSLLVECQGTCPAKDKCTNKRLTKRQYAPIALKHMGEDKDWGVIVQDDVKKGDLIIEYCGEIINEEICHKRLAEKKRVHYYMLQVSSDMIIDASDMGNAARFINHSCDPNCVTQKWTVGNNLRVGIFANRDISKDEEVTYDYNFCGFWDDNKKAQKCACKSENCSGFLHQRPLSRQQVEERRLKESKRKRKSKQ